MVKLKYFKSDEFLKLSWEERDIHIFLKEKLDMAREYAGIPFVISSAHRSIKQNEDCGGSATSSHLKGLAVDIVYSSEEQKIKIIYGLVKAGFTRIGVNIESGFVHADVDREKPDAVFTY